MEETEAFVLQKLSLIPPTKRKLVTAHDAFQYFGKTYNIDLFPLQGVSPESEILIQDFQHIIKLIQQHQITAIFAESTINPKTLENLSLEAKCVIGGKLFADSLSDAEGEAPDYISMLRHNVTIISNGLTHLSEQTTPVVKNLNIQNIILYTLLSLLMGSGFLFLSVKSKQ